MGLNQILELEITERLLRLRDDPDAGLRDEVCYEQPVWEYKDRALWEAEREYIFRGVPLLAALSCQLPSPGDWIAFDEAGLPILLVRGQDGAVRAFLNVCRHRGARLVDEACGSARRFTCPFHGWVYNEDGCLVGMPAPRAFEGMCREDRGLRPVTVEEWGGAIWILASSTPAMLDVQQHLGPLGEEFRQYAFDELHFVERRVNRTRANWKLAMDTYTEGYHVPYLHKNSLGPLSLQGLALYDALGDHYRQAFALVPLEGMASQSKDQWRPFETFAFGLQYIIYPNTMFFIAPNHVELYQVFPGDAVDTVVTIATLFSSVPLTDDAERANLVAQFDFFYNIVANEDYRMADGIERVLQSAANETFVFGRVEPIMQTLHKRYHRQIAEGRVCSGVLSSAR